MAATATATAAFPPTGSVGGDLEDSNISSPLSEVDDKDANDEELDRMHLDDDDGDNSSLSGEEHQATHNDGSDSESALSDAASDVNSEANDTEAETLRLYDTPQNQRLRDVVVDQFNDDQVFEHSPSKLRSTQANPDDESVFGDEASIVSSRADGAESPKKTLAVPDASLNEDTQGGSQDRKRKRSLVTEQSDPEEQPIRKRTNSVVVREDEGDDEAAAIEDDTTSANPQSSHQSPGEDEDSPANQDTTPEEEVPERETRVAKKSTRGGSKRKSVATDSADDELPPEVRTESRAATVEDTAEHHDEDMEVDAEEEAAARNIEEMEKKQAAYRDWTHIEEMFGIFRDRLYKDRLQRLEEEEQSLHAVEPTHPEYLNMKQCLDDRLNQKLQAINTEYEFRIRAHDRRAVAQRAQIWSQYFQAVRERREQALEALNKQWYDVQSARRSAHSLPDYGLLFPKDPSQRVRNAIAYNTEVSTLAGLTKYEGFPAGPDLNGASASELEADLALMERARRGRQKPITHLREEYQPPHLTRLGPAGEQFLKDTPWANPNHSSHKLYQSTGQTEPPLSPCLSLAEQRNKTYHPQQISKLLLIAQ
ncbi:hypothetical protein PT974_08806 [Cladobotryum mycophilum]|uniref:Transcriptional regulatory protein DEP1 n=1 Tax=Cladobotryum mycophilum TaxID=491253 RepID=A0ABR0SEC2_9HYPO